MTSKKLKRERSVRVVLADANVLFPRVLRDYLLYAAAQGVLQVRWSREILQEVTRNLILKYPQFDEGSASRLIAAMNSAFPAAEVLLTKESQALVEHLPLPDEDDRHVIAAALAVDADILCTDNLKDFPAETLDEVGIAVMSADALLSLLVKEYPQGMLAAHKQSLERLPGATDESTIKALRRAGATSTAQLVQSLLRD